jgi:hypothetical protein
MQNTVIKRLSGIKKSRNFSILNEPDGDTFLPPCSCYHWHSVGCMCAFAAGKYACASSLHI